MNFLGKIFATLWQRPAVQRWLMRKTYGHLYTGGEVYMYRYDVANEDSLLGKALGVLTLGRYDHVRLHIIMRPDRDREMHNHPFKYRTFILSGFYVEHRPMDDGIDGSIYTKLNTKGDTATGEGYHRIAVVPYSGVTTLFFMSKRSVGHGGEGSLDGWGFLVDGKHMPSREFFKLRNIRNNGKAV